MTAADGESNSTVSPPSPKCQKTALDILLGEQDERETQASRMNFIDTSQKKWPLETPIHWSGGTEQFQVSSAS